MMPTMMRGSHETALCLTSRWALKIPLSLHARHELAVELERNRAALEDPLWQDFVVPVISRLSCLVSRRAGRLTQADVGIADRFVADRAVLLKGLPRASAARLVPPLEPVVGGGTAGFADGLYDRLRNALEGMTLPISSAHGDLHAENLVLLEGRISLVDWRNYRRMSSLAFDVVNYYVQAAAVGQGKKWVQVLDCGTSIAVPGRDVIQAIGVDFDKLLGAYALNRTALEIDALGGITQVSSLKLQKYSIALREAARLLL